MTDPLSDPARAFDELRREVSLAVRAIQGLTAEHKDTPDYSDTLVAIDQKLTAVSQTLAAVAKSPAMSLTPENLAHRIQAASSDLRRDHADLINGAVKRLDGQTSRIAASFAQARSAQDQRTWLVRAAVGGLVAGIVIGLVVAFWLARTADPARAGTPSEPIASKPNSRSPAGQNVAFDPNPVPLPDRSAATRKRH